MKIYFPLALCAFALATALAAFPQQSPAPTRALGTVKILGSAACPSGATTGSTCKSIQVTCPGIPVLDGTLGQALATGTVKGTIILVSGEGGTTFFNSNFANTYLADGYNVVQIAWATDWEDTGGVGLAAAACRPATVFNSIFNTTHKKSRTAGFCAQGISGGGGAIAYALTQYGMQNYFDYVVIGAGPGVSRMDYGCDSALYTGGPLNLCPLLTNAPYVYFKGDKFNTWEGTTTCKTPNPPQADINKWLADSLVTSGATYNYPQTAVSFFDCVTNPNSSTGQAVFLIDQVTPKNLPVDVNCYSGVCQGEAVWQDPSAYSLTVSDMLAQCVPNHQ
jgi:hypothetical protein